MTEYAKLVSGGYRATRQAAEAYAMAIAPETADQRMENTTDLS